MTNLNGEDCFWYTDPKCSKILSLFKRLRKKVSLFFKRGNPLLKFKKNRLFELFNILKASIFLFF